VLKVQRSSKVLYVGDEQEERGRPGSACGRRARIVTVARSRAFSVFCSFFMASAISVRLRMA
jgi:hypothetical protein